MLQLCVLWTVTLLWILRTVTESLRIVNWLNKWALYAPILLVSILNLDSVREYYEPRLYLWVLLTLNGSVSISKSDLIIQQCEWRVIQWVLWAMTISVSLWLIFFYLLCRGHEPISVDVFSTFYFSMGLVGLVVTLQYIAQVENGNCFPRKDLAFNKSQISNKNIFLNAKSANWISSERQLCSQHSLLMVSFIWALVSFNRKLPISSRF